MPSSSVHCGKGTQPPGAAPVTPVQQTEHHDLTVIGLSPIARPALDTEQRRQRADVIFAEMQERDAQRVEEWNPWVRNCLADREDTDRKIEQLFESLNEKHGSAASASEPAPEPGKSSTRGYSDRLTDTVPDIGTATAGATATVRAAVAATSVGK